MSARIKNTGWRQMQMGYSTKLTSYVLRHALVKEANALRTKSKLKRKEPEEPKKGNISYRKKLKLMNN